MLPSLLTRDIQDGLKQFLTTGFEPSDHHLHGLMARFVARRPLTFGQTGHEGAPTGHEQDRARPGRIPALSCQGLE
jgi:hypothetical protein